MLNIFLGYACNLKCEYCLQTPEAKDADRKKHDPAPFIERIAPLMLQKGIRDVAYWGGEPLIYWKQIEAIHEGLLAKGVPIRFIKFATNGTLLQQEHVDALNRWDATVILSQHQQYGQPNWEMAAKLQRSSLAYLFTHETLTAWRWFDEIATLEQRHGRFFWPVMYWVRATDGADPRFYMTHADLDLHEKHLWELADLRAKGDRYAHAVWEGHLQEWRAKYKPDHVGPVAARCYSDDHISVTLTGDRYICHHSVKSSLKTGNVFQTMRFTTPKEMLAIEQANRFVRTEECMTCPIRTYCRGSCHLSTTPNVDCRLSKIKHQILSHIDQQERACSPS